MIHNSPSTLVFTELSLMFNDRQFYHCEDGNLIRGNITSVLFKCYIDT